jgi:glycosyltransferase involved in cell wall biosynthesis
MDIESLPPPGAARRVMMVSQHKYDGHPTLSRNLAELLTQGVAIDLICISPRFWYGRRHPERPGLRVYGLPITLRRSPAFWYLLQYIAFFVWALVVVSGLALRHRYDVVQVDTTPDFLAFSALAPRLRRMRVVLFSMELMPELTAARLKLGPRALVVRVTTCVERAATSWSDHVITVSDRCRRIMAERGLDAGKITVVPNSHPVAGVPQACPASPPFLVVQTSLIERYGVHVAIRALAELRDEWPELTMQVLGEGGALVSLVNLADQLGISDRVAFSGRYLPWEEMMDRVRQATVGIVPILADGYGDLLLPNKVLELASLGVPAVCSRLPSIEEHFPPDSLAYFEPGDAAGLAAQLRHLLGDPQAGRQQAARAREAIAELEWASASRSYLRALGITADGEPAIAVHPASSSLSSRGSTEAPAPASGSSALYEANTPGVFWRFLPKQGPSPTDWSCAIQTAAIHLPEAVRERAGDIETLPYLTLGEGQFGSEHWRLSEGLRLYYAVKPLIPRWTTQRLRRLRGPWTGTRHRLGWPIEDRYVRFQWEVARQVMLQQERTDLPFIHFWPEGFRYAFVLTHDVDTAGGQDRALELAELDASYGFRSSFNFVPEQYRLDHGIVAELRARGFEVGVHGLQHDGKLFSSHPEFLRQARRINRHLKALQATGFRAPLTHRNPEWMQALDIDYDLSFFDTDPHEPMPGGTMSIWPFTIGRFIELPYTLVQDYTLTSILRETTPRLWLQKVDFIRDYCGMALLNTHPDYLVSPRTRHVYVDFLREMRDRADYWHALPGEVAGWWRARAKAASPADLPGAVQGTVELSQGRVSIAPAADMAAAC